MFHGMAAQIHGMGMKVLTDAQIKAAKGGKTPYKLADTGQLYLYVTPPGGRYWRMNYTFGRNEKGRPAQKTLSLGSYPSMTLTGARAARDKAKSLLREGIDPGVHRRVAHEAAVAEHANTFEKVARRWHALKADGWGAVNTQDVIRSLERDVFPFIGDLPITMIKAPKLLEVLQAVENRGAIETAHRIRQRISATFVYGIATGACESDPAASLGVALKLVPTSSRQPSIVDGHSNQDARLTAVRQLLIDVEAERCRAVTKLAMRFLALTAVRPNLELGHARWDELHDLEGKHPTWLIPSARMKGDKDRKRHNGADHPVPLSRQALDVIEALRPLTGKRELMFPGERHLHRPMSENTLRALLIRAGYYQRHVPHGFRAAFSTIMNERPREEREDGDRAVIDLMLGHVPSARDAPREVRAVSASELDYNRALYMPRRRELAQQWADMLLEGFWHPSVHVDQPIRWAATGAGRP